MSYSWEDVSHLSEEALYQSLSTQPHFFFLDSSDSESKWSRFSIMGANPFLVMSTQNGQTTLTDSEGIRLSDQNPFDILDSLLTQYTHNEIGEKLPFIGGAVGYVGYEASRYLEPYKKLSFYTESPMPDIYFAFYHNTYVIDKYLKKIWKISHASVPSALREGTEAKSSNRDFQVGLVRSSFSVGGMTGTFPQNLYIEAIKKAKSHIYEGDLYQLNLSHRVEAPFTGDIHQLYLRFRTSSPAPYSAFLDTGQGQILSASPEQFLKIQGTLIQTRPIKGTIKRGQTPDEDTQLKAALLNSEKNKSELMMIVDLMRNDLGQVCVPGSVKVPELLTLESYAQVHHLVSTIEGQLNTTSHVEAFKALFPGGSITGAPKLRAMQRIQELETHPRSVYTGALGYFGFNQQTQFNIAIRTVYASQNKLYFHGGGGIVADSDPKEEWEETLLKVKGVMDCLSMKRHPI